MKFLSRLSKTVRMEKEVSAPGVRCPSAPNPRMDLPSQRFEDKPSYLAESIREGNPLGDPLLVGVIKEPSGL